MRYNLWHEKNRIPNTNTASCFTSKNLLCMVRGRPSFDCSDCLPLADRSGASRAFERAQESSQAYRRFRPRPRSLQTTRSKLAGSLVVLAIGLMSHASNPNTTDRLGTTSLGRRSCLVNQTASRFLSDPDRYPWLLRWKPRICTSLKPLSYAERFPRTNRNPLETSAPSISVYQCS